MEDLWKILKTIATKFRPDNADYELFFNDQKIGVIKSKNFSSELFKMKGRLEPTQNYDEVKSLFEENSKLMSESFRLRDSASKQEIDEALGKTIATISAGKLKIHKLEDDSWHEVAQIDIRGNQVIWRWGQKLQ